MRHVALAILSISAACSSASGTDDLGTDLGVSDLGGADFAGIDLNSQMDLGAGADASSDGATDGAAPHLGLNSVQWELANDVGEDRNWSPMVTLTALDAVQASVAAEGTGDDGG